MKSIYIKNTIIILLLGSFLCTFFVGCAQKAPQPADTIYQLQKSINKFDIDGILQCISQEWENQLEPVLSFTVGKNGISIKDFLTVVKTILPILPFIGDVSITANDFPNVEFTILKTAISGDNATVMLAGILSLSGYEGPFAATIEMKLEDGVWVVCGVT